jgi:NADPH-dependent 2,4-dienoyl-CoA reductase/sulfur reductase-like enzyme
MTEYQYLIIGGGMTADSAVKGIRQIDKFGKIGIITSENHLPYNRPPLSKMLWKGDPLESIWRQTPKANVEIHLSKMVKSIDPQKKIVIDNTGINYSYDKLLLATGGAVKRLPYNIDGIIYYRTLDDYQNLRKLTERGQNFVVIGGGFIGSEIAAALAINNKSVTMIFPDDSIGARVYPLAFSHFLNSFYQSKGVEILAKDGVENIVKHELTYLVRTKSGRELKADGVIAGIGIQPNVELAKMAGFKIENGIVVDEFLRTSHPDIYAAGDVANFYNPSLDKRIRAEHEDHANTSGEIVGKNMAGENIIYNHLPSFYSDLFDIGYEAVGELDSSLEIVEDWKDEFREGVVYYLSNEKIHGVLLLNVWGQVDAARKLIEENKSWNKQNIKGLIPF